MRITERKLRRIIKEEVETMQDKTRIKANSLAKQIDDIIEATPPEVVYYMFEYHYPGTIPGSDTAEVSPSEARELAEQFNKCIKNCAYQGGF